VKKFITACLITGFVVCPALADIIYFKDGMKTICQERAWEEDGEIKCEYAGWIITYKKGDILRIVKSTRPQKKTPPQPSAVTPKPATIEKSAKPDKKSSAVVITAPGTTASNLRTKPKQVTGPVFYDPRRPYKYWADQNSKHKTYQAAIAALAKKYKTTPAWVQAHMGETNDLVQIHRNLGQPQPEEISSKIQPAPATNSTVELIFYNPRRPFPYWTDEKSKHKTFKEAIQALANRYNRSPDWIKLNMGSTNDLNAIHRNLKEHQTAEPQ
jgi:hypothetical protein